MSYTNDITREQAKNYALKQANTVQEHLNAHQQTLRSTDDYRKAYTLSLTIDVLTDNAVIDEIHWELTRGRRQLSDELGVHLFHRLVYDHNTTGNYVNLYRRSMQ